MKYNIYKWRKVFVWNWVDAFEAGYDPKCFYKKYTGDIYRVRFEYVETKLTEFNGQVYRIIKN